MKWITQPLRISTATVFAVVLLALVAPDAQWLRLMVGLPLVLLLPGRAIVMAFDPHRRLGEVERFAISIALSISLTIGCGMLLASSPLTLSAGGCVFALAAITLVSEAVALNRCDEDADAVDIRRPLRTVRVPVVAVALSLGAMLLVTGIAVGRAGFRPSSGELVQMWMLPDTTRDDGGVEIGVEKRISAASNFTLQYFQGSETASDTPLVLQRGTSVVFTRAPLITSAENAPAIESRLTADNGRTRSHSVSWWPR